MDGGRPKPHVLAVLTNGRAGNEPAHSAAAAAAAEEPDEESTDREVVAFARTVEILNRQVLDGQIIDQWSFRQAVLTSKRILLSHIEDEEDHSTETGRGEEIRLLDIKVVEAHEEASVFRGRDLGRHQEAGLLPSTQGWMSKRGGINTALQMRYFILRQGVLTWFKQRPDSVIQDQLDHASFNPAKADASGFSPRSMGALGWIYCSNAEVEPNIGEDANGYYFAIAAKSGTTKRRVVLCCESQDQRQKWVDVIHLSADAKNRADALHADESQLCFRIFVESKSKNYILCSHTQEERDLWLTNIQDAIVENHKAILRALNDTPIKRLRSKVAVLYAADGFQKFVAFMLFLNFILNVLDAEFADDRELESQQQQQNGGSDGKFTTMARYFEIADLLFTVFYIIELLLNLFAHWLREFLDDGWSMFDAFCVFIGLFGTASGISSAQIVRSIRILRIVRIFKRFRTLQHIVIAISRCVLKIFHTFLITAIILCIYSVVVTQSFGWLDPGLFGSFSLSMMTMVQVMTGDGWMTDIVRPLIQIGEEHDEVVSGFGALVMFVFFSFVLLVFVVMLNVTVSVLLEGFLTAMQDIDSEERAKARAWEATKLVHNLDPVLEHLSTYSSPEHLSSMINSLFDRLDRSCLGALCYEDWKGLEAVAPNKQIKVHLTRNDFDIFTVGRKYLAADTGRINRENFVYCVRLELNSYAHRRITNAMQALQEAGTGSDAAMCLSQKITMTNLHMERIKEQDPRIAPGRAADSARDWKQMESNIAYMVAAQVQSSLHAAFDRQEARMEMLLRRILTEQAHAAQHNSTPDVTTRPCSPPQAPPGLPRFATPPPFSRVGSPATAPIIGLAAPGPRLAVL